MHDPSTTAALPSAETMLQESEGCYCGLFENANDGICVVSREGRYVAVNQKYAELTGLRKEEIIGQSAELFLPEGSAQWLDRIEQAIIAGRFGPYEMEVTTPLGKKVFSMNSFACCQGEHQ